GKGDGVFLGEIFADPEKKTQGVAPGMNLRTAPKNGLPRVERADQKIQIRDTRGSSRDGRASNAHGTASDKLYRVNGKVVK
ncbi:MAG: hypothetical protein MJZ22_04575, partial [Candidatus Saccharibacteria bacterium]|nr:hypothetical protein [Candidatus Saccharibacteria bacterium]